APSHGASDSGTLQVGGTTITFAGLQPVTVHDVPSFTFTPPGDSADLRVDSPASGQNRISGSSDGTAFESVTFYNVPSITIDTSVHETSAGVDRVSIDGTGLVAAGLQN